MNKFKEHNSGIGASPTVERTVTPIPASNPPPSPSSAAQGDDDVMSQPAKKS